MPSPAASQSPPPEIGQSWSSLLVAVEWLATRDGSDEIAITKALVAARDRASARAAGWVRSHPGSEAPGTPFGT